jgi:hypothetical protein
LAPIAILLQYHQRTAEIQRNALKLQAIPLDPSLYNVDNFRPFLESRRKAEVVSAFLGKVKGE